MTGIKPVYGPIFYRGNEIIVLDSQQRLLHSFAVIANGYNTFSTLCAAKRFIRSL
jgi:hypothetical protein